MKKIYLIVALFIGMISCNKPSVKTMNAEELKASHGIVLPDLFYEGDEESTSINRAGQKKEKANAVLVEVVEDLEITGSVECSVSENAQWGAIQKFLALPLSVEGATVLCNFYWSRTGTDFPTPMVCPTSEPGVYRGWTGDAKTSSTPYKIRLSPPFTL